jgi:hypothetical protein
MTIHEIIENMSLKLGDIIVSKSGKCAVCTKIDKFHITLFWNDGKDKNSSVEIENMALMVHYGKWQIVSA